MISLADDEHAAGATAAFLVRLGHRRVAYISAFATAPWSMLRLRTLAHAFGSAGIEGGVAAFTFAGSDEYYRRKAQRRRPVREPAALLLREAGAMGLGKSKYVATNLREAVYRYMGMAEVYAQLSALLTQALDKHDITAWVCDSDFVAILALDFAHTHGIRVPEHISIVGFDDSPGAASAGLTRYNFDLPSVARALVQNVLGSSGPPVQRASGFMHIDGMIVSRNSSGRARRLPWKQQLSRTGTARFIRQPTSPRTLNRAARSRVPPVQQRRMFQRGLGRLPLQPRSRSNCPTAKVCPRATRLAFREGRRYLPARPRLPDRRSEPAHRPLADRRESIGEHADAGHEAVRSR